MIRTIAARAAELLLRGGGIDLVDVREPSEFARGHLPGARSVPLAELRGAPERARLGRRVLFVCASGGRSLAASKLAEALGIDEVYNLDGGTTAWAGEGLPIEVPPATAAPPAPEPGAEQVPEEPAEPTDTDPELDGVVSANVRDLRARRGYTLDQLAGLSGVARHTLGQIELGRTVPSVAALWKIARAFEVPFSALLAQPVSRTTTVLRRQRARRLVSADARFSSRSLFPGGGGGGGGVEFYELWLAPHGREDAEPHAPGTRENLVVNSGRLSLDVGEETFELGEGDAIEFIADIPHSYVNTGPRECWMNLVMTYRTAR